MKSTFKKFFKMKDQDEPVQPSEQDENRVVAGENQSENSAETAENEQVASAGAGEADKLKAQAEEYKNKFLYLASEFENYKRISARDRREYLASAGRDIVAALLPVLDDFDRAAKNDALTEGTALIHQKLVNLLANEGLKKIETKAGDEFDTTFHNAIVEIPAPAPDLKGKVVDVTDHGYIFKDKIIRHTKVVVGM